MYVFNLPSSQVRHPRISMPDEASVWPVFWRFLSFRRAIYVLSRFGRSSVQTANFSAHYGYSVVSKMLWHQIVLRLNRDTASIQDRGCFVRFTASYSRDLEYSPIRAGHGSALVLKNPETCYPR